MFEEIRNKSYMDRPSYLQLWRIFFCSSYHEDKRVKTGGGFTYFKKDRPENEIMSRNPSNWKIHDPSRTLKKLMEGKMLFHL